MTVTIQQILFTAHATQWHRLATALGLIPPYAPTPEWAEFNGNGILAIHHDTPEYVPGRVDIHLLVDDLAAAERAVSDFDIERGTMEGVGELLTVRTSSGVTITVSAGGGIIRSGKIAVQPIWFQTDLDEPRRILEALGLQAKIVSNRGGWVELVADGGGFLGLHHGDKPHIGLSFLASGDLDAHAARLREAGFDPAIIDEAFGRTIRLPDPDGGEDVWINGVQDDLYGYQRTDL